MGTRPMSRPTKKGLCDGSRSRPLMSTTDQWCHPSCPRSRAADMGYDSHINREAIHAKGGRQRIVQRSAWGRVRKRPERRSMPGTRQLRRFVAGSKKCSAHGSAPTGSPACASLVWPRQVCRFTSPPSPTISGVPVVSLLHNQHDDQRANSIYSKPRKSKYPKREISAADSNRTRSIASDRRQGSFPRTGLQYPVLERLTR
jgi:hypothetical protein